MTATVIDRASELITQVRGKALETQQREKPALWERASEIRDAAAAENRPMSADERAKYDELTGLIADINEREQEEQNHLRLTKQFTEIRRDPRALPGSDDGGLESRGEYRKALNRYLRFGSLELEPEERKVLRQGYRVERPGDGGEARAQGTAPGSAGGYLVPSQMGGFIVETLKLFGGVAAVATTLETSNGQPIEYPTNDDTANTGALIGENVAATSLDLVFGQKKVDAYLFTSKIVLVPITLLMDSAIDIEAYIARKVGQRLGRTFNSYQTTGTGAGQPQGLTVGASVGKSFAGAAAVTYNELIDLEHSVDAAYRQDTGVPQGGDGQSGGDWVGYMFNDPSTFAALRKLADSQNRPLWVPWLGQGIAGAVPPTLNGWRYQINNDMPNMATTNKDIAFGNFTEGMLIRTVSGMSIMRLEERYAEYGQVGFLAFARMDSAVIDTAAVKLGQQA